MRDHHPTAAEDLAALFPSPRLEVIEGRSIAIHPLKVRQLGPYSEATKSFLGQIIGGDYLGALTHHTDDVLASVAIVTGVEKDWLAELEADVALKLVAAVFEVNIDFFAQRLLPQRAAMGARMHKLLEHWVGQQVLPALSDGATALPISQS